MAGVDPSDPQLGTRTLVTWLELTVVGITGGVIGGTLGGPPGFVVYLLTTLLTVAVLLYNVNELVERRVGGGANTSGGAGSPNQRHGDGSTTRDDGGDAAER